MRTKRPVRLREALGSVLVGLVLVLAASYTTLVGRPEFLVPLLAVPPLMVATRRRDAVTVLTLYVMLLFVLPSRLVVGPIGSTGTPANLIGLAALAWWFATWLVPGLGVAMGSQPVRLALLLLGMSFTVSYSMANLHRFESIEISGANRALIALAALTGVCFLSADGIASRDRLDALLRRVVAGATFMASLGIIQFFTGLDIAGLFEVPGLTASYSFGDVGQRSIFNRVQGTAIHPIEFGVVLALVLPIALHYALIAPPGKRRWPVLCAGLIALAVPTAVSRSGILALGVVWIMLLLGWTWRQRGWALAGSAAFIVVVRVLVPGLVGTISSLFTNLFNDPSTTGRTDDYAVVGRFIREAPVFGRGMFTFIPSRYTTLDNQYLLTTIEMGFVGLAALVLLYLVGIFTARGARRRSADPETRQLGQALAAALLAAMVTAVTFDQLGFPMVTGVLFLLLGCAGALWRLTGGPGSSTRERVPSLGSDGANRPFADLPVSSDRPLHDCLPDPPDDNDAHVLRGSQAHHLAARTPGTGDLYAAARPSGLAMPEPGRPAAANRLNMGCSTRENRPHAANSERLNVRTVMKMPDTPGQARFPVALSTTRRTIWWTT